MLRLIVGAEESFNEMTNEFLYTGGTVLDLEHSLVSLSKWESEFEKPFLAPNEKTDDEVRAYIRCMIVTPDFPPEVLQKLTAEDFEEVNAYIGRKMTASWFNETASKATNQGVETITAELIYFWMISFSIPLECETWHLNRLFTLIKVFNVKNSKPVKKGPKESAAERRALNEARRKQFGTQG